MLSNDRSLNSQEMLCTPQRTQKRLCRVEGSTSKRSLFQQTNPQIGNDTSGDESDLGPMSPLALTDHSSSSSHSSPGRQFISPLATPEGSPQIPLMNVSWDRLKPTSHSDNRFSPFSSLNHITQTARSSLRRTIFPTSPKSCSPSKTSITTIKSSIRYNEEFVPETPSKDENRNIQNKNRAIGTPQREADHEYKMITPLGSVNKNIILPRLHRRKSLGSYDIDEVSPKMEETTFKRHINDSNIVETKFQKTDESCSIPKARASLFQENQKNKNISIEAKSFFGNRKQKRLRAFRIDWKQIDQSKKRRSLVNRGSSRPHKKNSQKRHRNGEINCGVFHGIKKPKPKKHVSRVEAFEKKKQVSLPIPTSEIIQPTSSSFHSTLKLPENKANQQIERTPSPEINPTKKFFKMVKSKLATVTVNTKIKLNVSDGKITLKQKSVHKKPKLDISLDATDLTVDEPEMESSKNKDVEKLLKILEDDWSDEDYIPIDTLEKKQGNLKKYPCFQDVMMSPASELSTMTSVMNIEDTTLLVEGKLNVEENTKQTSTEGQRIMNYYPLFTKGYSSNRKEINDSKNRGVKRAATWQLSAKIGEAEGQYQIDCGQKNFGAIQCKECGVLYQAGDPQDENAHLNFHNNMRTLRFQGWKNERVVWEEEYTSSKIILVEPSDSKKNWKKVSEILNVVDIDLGLADMQLSYYRDKKVYLFIRDKNVLGVLVVEPVKQAHRMIPEFMELDCCSFESSPVKCGINVVWTAVTHRKQGIAKQLVDTLRRSYYYGYIMTIDDIAFSTPTPSGKIFAEKYTKTRNFKVYS